MFETKSMRGKHAGRTCMLTVFEQKTAREWVLNRIKIKIPPFTAKAFQAYVNNELCAKKLDDEREWAEYQERNSPLPAEQPRVTITRSPITFATITIT